MKIAKSITRTKKGAVFTISHRDALIMGIYIKKKGVISIQGFPDSELKHLMRMVTREFGTHKVIFRDINQDFKKITGFKLKRRWSWVQRGFVHDYHGIWRN